MLWYEIITFSLTYTALNTNYYIFLDFQKTSFLCSEWSKLLNTHDNSKLKILTDYYFFYFSI